MIDKYELPGDEDIVLRAAAKAARELEGEQYLEVDPLPPPPEAYAKFHAKLTRCRRARRRKWLRVLVIAAALLALVATAAIALKLHSDSLRLKPNDVYAEIHLDGAPHPAIKPDDVHQAYLITVPEGFQLNDFQRAAGQCIVTYRHTEKGNLYFYQSVASTATNTDIEQADCIAVTVGDYQGYYTTKGAIHVLCWSQDGMLLTLETAALEQDELIALACSTVWRE